MAINLVYEDPQLLGETTRDAYGLAQRRKNLSDTLDRQLQADQANAHLGLGYDQLQASLAQRELDRNAEIDNQQANREFQAQQAAQEDAAALQRIRAAGEQQQANLTFELDARQRQELKKLDGVLQSLERQKAQGLWNGRLNEYEAAVAGIHAQAAGIKSPPMPPVSQEKRPGLYERAKADGRLHEFEDGSMLFEQPNGDLEYKLPQRDFVAIQKNKDEAKAAQDKINAEAEAKQKDFDAIQKIAIDLMGATYLDDNDIKRPKYKDHKEAVAAAIEVYRELKKELSTPQQGQQNAPQQTQQDQREPLWNELDALYAKYNGASPAEFTDPADQTRFLEITNQLRSMQAPAAGGQ